MSTTVQRPQSSAAQPARAQLATNPYVGILAVFLGAGLATLNSRFVLTNLPKRMIIFGIAAYAADIVFVSNIASLQEA
jgi:hypothetical protein